MKKYIEELKTSIENYNQGNITFFKQNEIEVINVHIKENFTAEYLKKIGAFFTEPLLSLKAIQLFQNAITVESVVLDPSCGVGSLLIESSRQLGVRSLLSDTLKEWNNVLKGFDTQRDFIEISKLRIVLEALNRGVKKDCSIDQAITYLNNIELRDALSILEEDVTDVTHLFMNPPFVSTTSPKRDYWGKGKTNSAAVFFDYYLRMVSSYCNVVAILPDVLRSGSLFVNFRHFVNENLNGQAKIWGRFSDNADVDVFILSGIKECANSKIEWVKPVDEGKTILADQFNVSVGAVVPHRDKQIGKKYPYFHPRNCKNWEIINTAGEYRAFSGKVVQSPCVLIKRTSSPTDRFRAAATLIRLNEPIAVENHLIVATPKDGSLRSCKKLLKVLANARTSQFLNTQIRARHLTVGAVKSIPID